MCAFSFLDLPQSIQILYLPYYLIGPAESAREDEEEDFEEEELICDMIDPRFHPILDYLKEVVVSSRPIEADGKQTDVPYQMKLWIKKRRALERAEAFKGGKVKLRTLEKSERLKKGKGKKVAGIASLEEVIPLDLSIELDLDAFQLGEESKEWMCSGRERRFRARSLLLSTTTSLLAVSALLDTTISVPLLAIVDRHGIASHSCQSGNGFTSSSDDRNNPSRRRNVVFDSNEASTNGNRTSKNNQNATEGNRDRFNGRENLPTFDIVVQPPSPTSSSSNQNQANSQSSRKSSNDSKGREKTRMEDEERRKVQEVLASESGRNTEQEEWVEPTTTTASNKNNNRSKSSGKKGNASVSESDPFVLAEEEEEGEDEDDWARNAWSKLEARRVDLELEKWKLMRVKKKRVGKGKRRERLGGEVERYYASHEGIEWPREVYDYNERFTKTLELIKKRHDAVVTTLAQGVLEYKRSRKGKNIQADVQRFLDRFYMSRIGIRILIGQQIALARSTPTLTQKGSSKIQSTISAKSQDGESDGPEPEQYVGIICTNTDVGSMAHEAIENARFVCEEHYGLFRGPPVQLVCPSNLTFMYVPSHLNHMLFELLKNSLRAVVERYGVENEDNFPLSRSLLWKEKRISRSRLVMKVEESLEDFRSLTAILIPIITLFYLLLFSEMPLVWTYMYTTAQSEDLDPEFSASDFKAPMAGFGYGLPLARLYARYFGGDLKLISMEGYGTDVYLHMNRLSSSSEPLP
ncbi:hypothetical protein L7F22_012026 [Adiantum nelumboides]|nr:hypothetical protein [Adiantum nelumboides]